MYSNMIGEIRMTVQNMRKAKDMIRGDGFGRAGYLKSEFKKAIRRLESLQAMLEEGPLEEGPLEEGPLEEGPLLEAAEDDANPNCCGHLEDNVPNCICRQIEATIKKLKESSVDRELC
jgi:hypothetical protein